MLMQDVQMQLMANALDMLGRDSLIRHNAWFPAVPGPKPGFMLQGDWGLTAPDLDKFLLFLGIGLAGEAGEVADEIKKVVRDQLDCKADLVKLYGEMADLMIYFSLLSYVLEMDWPTYIEAAIDRCEARWGRVDVS